MLLRVTHRTFYRYAGQARESFNEARLRPLDDAGQRCLAFALRLNPATEPRAYADFYGNTVHYFEVAPPHEELRIEAESLVETTPAAARPPVPAVPPEHLEAAPEREMLAEFYHASHYVPLEVELWREALDVLAD
ncbi:MAG: transglutaminase N-terminal domain-containing protein, partial [Opitutaceae bacterium]